jgi:hypothetical protein
LIAANTLANWRGTLRAMSQQQFYFAYFWFSHRPGGGEASA